MVGSRSFRLEDMPHTKKGDMVHLIELDCGHKEYFVQFDAAHTPMYLLASPEPGMSSSECAYGCKHPKVKKAGLVRGWGDT